MIKGSNRMRSLVGFAAVAVIAAACSSSGASTAPSGAATQRRTRSATRTAAASATASAKSRSAPPRRRRRRPAQATDLTVIHRNTDAAGQLADIRTLIAKGVNAIVFNPNDPKALNPALAEAAAAGIKTVAVDSYVTDTNTWNLYNNQVKYAELGAKWLFDQLGGKGTVWYTRGIAGNSADSDRDVGFKNVLKDYPGITVVPSPDGVATGWDPATATKLTNDFIASGGYDKITGIWASGMGKQIVDAIKANGKKFVPIADADVGGFVTQLLDPTGFPGLKGAAVTNTAAVGGAGITLALKLLNGETVTASSRRHPAEHRSAGPGRGRQPHP